MFTFRQFVVHDDRCAMKVGTDGVLLGAWARLTATDEPPQPTGSESHAAPIENRRSAKRVLDVGTGCGLVALLLAQRFPEAYLVALEIDPQAAEQAAENVTRSPFAQQIDVLCADFLDDNHCASLRDAAPFDAIVSNPPFFEETLLAPDAPPAPAPPPPPGHPPPPPRRGGSLEVIVPKSAQERFHAAAADVGCSLVRATDVQTVARKAPKRVLLHFVKGAAPERVERDTLILLCDGQRSAQYAELCRDFYL
jgi:ribosomal protein L11 methyltransferase (prmA)